MNRGLVKEELNIFGPPISDPNPAFNKAALYVDVDEDWGAHVLKVNTKETTDLVAAVME